MGQKQIYARRSLLKDEVIMETSAMEDGCQGKKA